MTIFDDFEDWLDRMGGRIKKNIKETGKAVKEAREIIKESNMNNITINDESFQVSGNNVIIKNNKVIVNGEIIKEGLKGIVKVEFEGDVANLDCTSATINGNVEGDVNGTTINITGDVDGDVDGVTIKCGDVEGDVEGTTVTCGDVDGDVEGINIRIKK